MGWSVRVELAPWNPCAPSRCVRWSFPGPTTGHLQQHVAEAALGLWVLSPAAPAHAGPPSPSALAIWPWPGSCPGVHGHLTPGVQPSACLGCLVRLMGRPWLCPWVRAAQVTGLNLDDARRTSLTAAGPLPCRDRGLTGTCCWVWAGTGMDPGWHVLGARECPQQDCPYPARPSRSRAQRGDLTSAHSLTPDFWHTTLGVPAHGRAEPGSTAAPVQQGFCGPGHECSPGVR